MQCWNVDDDTVQRSSRWYACLDWWWRPTTWSSQSTFESESGDRDRVSRALSALSNADCLDASQDLSVWLSRYVFSGQWHTADNYRSIQFDDWQKPCLTVSVGGQTWIDLMHPRIFQSDSVDMFSVANDIQQITTGPFNLTTDKNRVSRFLSGDKHGLTWCIPGSFSLTQLICFRWPNSIHSGQPLFENRQGPCHGSCLSFQTWIDLMHPMLFQSDSVDMFFWICDRLSQSIVYVLSCLQNVR